MKYITILLVAFLFANCSKKKDECESCEVKTNVYRNGDLVETIINPVPCGSKPGTTQSRSTYGGVTTVLSSTVTCK